MAVTPGIAGRTTAAAAAEQEFEIYVINLDRAPRRREAMQAQARSLSVSVQFVQAIDGQSLPDAAAAAYLRGWRRRTWRADLTPNEIACVLSHRKALQGFLASGAAFAVILEDDAVLDADFTRVVRELMAIAPVWDVVRLVTRVPDLPFSEVETLPSGRRLGQRPKWGLGGVGVLYDRPAAERLLRGSTRFFEAFDNLLGRPWVAGGYVLELDRPVVSIGGAPSTLETEASRAPARGRRMRGWWRLATGLHRRVMGPRALARFRAAAARARRG